MAIRQEQNYADAAAAAAAKVFNTISKRGYIESDNDEGGG